MTKLREMLINVIEQRDTDGNVIATSITTNDSGLALIDKARIRGREHWAKAIVDKAHNEAVMKTQE